MSTKPITIDDVINKDLYSDGLDEINWIENMAMLNQQIESEEEIGVQLPDLLQNSQKPSNKEQLWSFREELTKANQQLLFCGLGQYNENYQIKVNNKAVLKVRSS